MLWRQKFSVNLWNAFFCGLMVRNNSEGLFAGPRNVGLKETSELTISIKHLTKCTTSGTY